MSLPTCRITGSIVNAQGKPKMAVQFVARVSSDGSLPAEQAVGVSREAVHVGTDENGQFEFELVQGVEVVLLSNDLRYYRRFVVPNVTTIDFRSLP